MKKMIMALVIMCLFTSCGKAPDAENESSEEETILTTESSTEDTEKLAAAFEKLQEHCAGYPVAFPDPAFFEVYDITGDGCDDVFTGLMYGSGLVRNSIIVYDLENDVFYELGGWTERYSYEFDDDGELHIVEERDEVDDMGYTTVVTRGSAGLVDGELVFIPDED